MGGHLLCLHGEVPERPGKSLTPNHPGGATRTSATPTLIRLAAARSVRLASTDSMPLAVPRPGVVAVADRLPLSALLSNVLVAFTIEFDHKMVHRTTTHASRVGSGQDPWLVSLVMWSNCMQYVDDVGVTVGDLERLARTRTNLAGMRRWGTSPSNRARPVVCRSGPLRRTDPTHPRRSQSPEGLAAAHPRAERLRTRSASCLAPSRSVGERASARTQLVTSGRRLRGWSGGPRN
jgi:predicted membrane protein